MSDKELSHVDADGRVSMVDVGEKAITERKAVARGEVHLKVETIQKIKSSLIKKGDVLTIAQIAGISAAKRTAEIIPLCHPILLDQIKVDLQFSTGFPGIEITSQVRTTAKTGVEMEALTAVAVAALTIYDMVKSIDRTANIQNIRVMEKHGGKSGDLFNE